MLLETQNFEEKDFVIYSRNSMDEAYNFRIVFKNDPDKYSRIITFSQVRNFIEEYFPKNLIAYRILSNFPDLTISSKYGCIIYLGKEPELIFTDPVFAVRTIEEYIDDSRSIEFRFRIQKVGYSSVRQFKDRCNFIEEFYFDLKINEVVNQNDEIYVPALLKAKEVPKGKIQSKTDLNRNFIFIPEQQSLPTSVASGIDSNSTSIKINSKILTNRYNRFDDSVIMAGNNKLNLDEKPLEKEKNKRYKISFEKENRKESSVNQSRVTLRSNQFNVRINNREEGLSKKENVEIDNRLSNMNESQDTEFRKVQSLPPIKIRKVELSKDGAEVEITKKGPKETLFTPFIDNLKSEIPDQTITGNNKNESDIYRIVKLVQNSKTEYDKNNRGQVTLKTKNNKSKN